MLERHLRSILLLMGPVFFSACASQDNLQTVAAAETEPPTRCTKDCELDHSGSVRACSRMRPGTARDGLAVTECVDDSYTTLRMCYRSCD